MQKIYAKKMQNEEKFREKHSTFSKQVEKKIKFTLSTSRLDKQSSFRNCQYHPMIRCIVL